MASTKLTFALLLAAACSSETLVPAPDTAPPLVVWTTPRPSDTGVLATTEISAIFSESMDTASLTTSFTLSGPGGPVTGTASAPDDRTAVFLPAALPGGAMLTATITSDARDLAGNGLATPVSWIFTTAAAPDETAPSIASVSPAAGAVGNRSDTTVISATLSEPIDCASVTASSLQVLEAGTPVVGYVTCSGATITFHPLVCLPTETALQAFVDPTIRDLAGNELAIGTSWAFGMAPWTHELGTPGTDTPWSITTDAAGNVYIAGDTLGALGGTSAGGDDMFVIKYDATGKEQWRQQLGTSNYERALGVATDSAGNVYLTGSTGAGLDGNTSAGLVDLFVVKYDAAGTKQWTRQLGTSTFDYGQGIATDAAGNIYITGFTSGGLDGNTNAGGSDAYVVKYNGAGTKQWTRQVGGTGNDSSSRVATDAAGNVYICGYTDGTIDGNTSAGQDDLFVTKYDTAGAKQWTRQLGSPADDDAQYVATDAAGNVYVTGSTYGGLDGNTNVGNWDLFVVKYAPSGNKLWTRQLGTATNDYGFAVATDAAGGVYAAGETFGSLGAPNAGSGDILIVKYDAMGTRRWIQQLGTTGEDDAIGIAPDLAGNVFVGAKTAGGIDGASGTDIAVVKYQYDGRKR